MSEPAFAESTLSDSIGNFAELVAAGTPTPGGGSVAAYCGMLAASLGQMVCNLTIGKPKHAHAEPRLREVKSEIEALSARLRGLIAEDAASFESVLRAYRLPRETDEQKTGRAAEIQLALKSAVDVPLRTAQHSFEVLRLLGELADIGNPNALSDAAVAAQLALTALKGASYNVRVNVNSISDRDVAERAREQIDNLTKQAEAIALAVDAKTKA
jgi:formiminotetrahydrofolate cyclodeaminase